MREILAWTGGQPFLTQRICSLVANTADSIVAGQESEWVERLISREVIQNWSDNDPTNHLGNLRDRILQNKLEPRNLLNLYKEILRGEIIFDSQSPEQTELLLSGIIHQESGKLRAFNRIYQLIFNLDWVQENLTRFGDKA